MRLRAALFLALSFLFVCAQRVGAEESKPAQEKCRAPGFKPKLFENRPYFEAWPAAPHDPLTMVLIGKGGKLPYTPIDRAHTFLQGSIGIDTPLVGFDGKDTEDAPVGAKCLSFGVWLQGVFPMLLDGSSPGQPVADADYVVDLAFKASYGLSKRRRLSFLGAYGHESDHMPSDFEKIAEADPRFETYDVNFEYVKAGIDFQSEEKWGVVDLRFTSLFASGEGHQGFYSYGYPMEDGSKILPSQRNFEPAIGLQWMPDAKHGFRPYVTYDVRAPSTYDFRRSTGQTEKARVTQTIWVAIRDFNHQHRGVPDFGIQIYTGRNPFGQLREENSWWSASLGFILRQ